MQHPQRKTDLENEKQPEESGEWEKDQAERTYYYDDSHGYVVYSPEDDEGADDADDAAADA